MSLLLDALSDFVQNLVAFVMMIVLAIVSFFFTVFVVDIGAGFAGYGGNEYVVLSAALLVAAAILAGGISPLGYLSQTNQIEHRPRAASTTEADAVTPETDLK
jgi:hypothetical protein